MAGCPGAVQEITKRYEAQKVTKMTEQIKKRIQGAEYDQDNTDKGNYGTY